MENLRAFMLVTAIRDFCAESAFLFEPPGVENDASTAEQVVEMNHQMHDIIVEKEASVPADKTVAVIEYAASPFYGNTTTYDVALYQAKEGSSITDKMWSYKKTPASKDETLDRLATVQIVTDKKTGEVLSFEITYHR